MKLAPRRHSLGHASASLARVDHQSLTSATRYRRTDALLAQGGEPQPGRYRLAASPNLLQSQIRRQRRKSWSGSPSMIGGRRSPSPASGPPSMVTAVPSAPAPERNRSTHLATALGVETTNRSGPNGQLPESSHLVRWPIAPGTSTTGPPTLILPHGWIGFENKHPITVTSRVTIGWNKLVCILVCER
jgi:hypothetical protein